MDGARACANVWMPHARPDEPADHGGEARVARLDDLELLEPADRAEWRAWLAEHHTDSDGLWLAIGKKGGTRTKLTYDEAVEEALCFGWIDSTVRRIDDDRFKQLLTPRRAGSIWSAPNKERVRRLEEAGLMTDAGRAVIERAKADGSWDLLTDVEALVMPADLVEALDSEPGARDGWEAYTDGSKKIALYWIVSAKRAQTREDRIRATVRAAADGRPVR